MPAHGRTYRFGEFTLDVPGRRLSRRDRTIRLEPRPLDLLALLVEQRGALVRRDEIDAHFWSGAPVEVSAAINTLVRKVRRALGDSVASPRFIETVHAEGYRFIGPVEVVTTPDAPRRGRESAGGELASLPEVPLPWGTCALFVSLTVVGLAAYGGEPAIWRSGIPGWKLLAFGYALVLLINLAIARAAIEILDGNPAPRRRGVLPNCALAYVGLLAPAIAIGAEYNAINRHHLSERRTQAYRASNPDAVLGPDRQRLLGRDDVGADLRALFEDSQFARALTNGRFYKVDLDERFQLLKRAVVFGYEEFDRGGSRGFKLVRLPEPIARAIAFRPAGD